MPNNRLVIDSKPKNNKVFDSKPKMSKMGREKARSFQVVINAGQWTGFLLSMTYPTTRTVTQWSENNS